MQKIFEFIKLGGTWYYWLPEGKLDALVICADGPLKAIGGKYIKLQLVRKERADIILSKVETVNHCMVYVCKSKKYSGKVIIDTIFGENLPQNIYLKIL